MILIGLGSNLAFCGATPVDIISKAAEAMMCLGEAGVVSPLYRSPAWPDATDPAYVNAIMVFEQSAYQPATLLAALHAIEDGFGRQRAYLENTSLRYAPRTLDLDLLAYHDVVVECEEQTLILPHPAIAKRAFVLKPLADILPNWRHVKTGQTAQQMLTALASSEVEAVIRKN